MTLKMRAALALTMLSLACLVTLALTWAPLADRVGAWPFALLMWAGFLAAVGANSLGESWPRALSGGVTSIWICLWVLTWSEDALDLAAGLRRVALAFIAF